MFDPIPAPEILAHLDTWRRTADPQAQHYAAALAGALDGLPDYVALYLLQSRLVCLPLIGSRP